MNKHRCKKMFLKGEPSFQVPLFHQSALRDRKYKAALLLQQYVDAGFVLHGTHHNVTRIRLDEINTSAATTRDPDSAIFMAISAKAGSRSGELRFYYTWEGRKRFRTSSDVIEKLTAGYVYAISADYLIKPRGRRYSLMTVKPIAKLKVTPADFNGDILPLPVEAGYRGRMFSDEEIAIVAALCLSFYRMKDDTHGRDHVLSVIEYAKTIANKECREEFNDVIVGAALHDVGRTSSSSDNDHARRGSRIASNIIKKYWPALARKRIMEAITDHAQGMVTKDLLIGAIWDADRLDIVRCNYQKIKTTLLSTKTAKKIARKTNAWIYKTKK
jgi:hypothetical protein